MDHQFRGQEVHDTESNSAGGKKNPDKVEEPGPDDGRNRGKGVGVDDRRNRVGCVMKAVHELEPECQKQGQPQKEKCPGRDVSEERNVGQKSHGCQIGKYVGHERNSREYPRVSQVVFWQCARHHVGCVNAPDRFLQRLSCYNSEMIAEKLNPENQTPKMKEGSWRRIPLTRRSYQKLRGTEILSPGCRAGSASIFWRTFFTFTKVRLPLRRMLTLVWSA